MSAADVGGSGIPEPLPLAPVPGSVRLVGDAGVLVAVEGPRAAALLAAAIRAAHWEGVGDVVGGLRSVLVTLERGDTDPRKLVVRMARYLAGAPDVVREPGPEVPPEAFRHHRVRVVFDGPDLAEVSHLTGLGEGAVVELLCGTVLEVAMVGFSPGFGYLTGLPEPLRSLPRRASPRRAVAAGSVALAGGFAAVYPQATPGGWQLVGRTGTRLFDEAAPPYALLRPGDTVELVPVAVRSDPRSVGMARPASPADAADPAAADPDGPAPRIPGRAGIRSPPPARPPWRAGPGDRATFVVEEPGLLSLVQDGGRRLSAHLGVPRAGPVDPVAHELANRLVGNPAAAAALEVTARGPVLRCGSPAYISVVGGEVEVTLDDRPVACGHVIPVAPGQRLALGSVRTGLRAYLAVAGGLAPPEVLGSRSTDTFAWLGPGRLEAGDEMAVLGSGPAALPTGPAPGAPPGPMGDHLLPGWPTGVRGAGSRVLRVLRGPHAEWFPAGTVERLGQRLWVVEDASDRVGLRLRSADGGAPGAGIERGPGEVDPLGTVTGAVQVPPDGMPVVLGPDHATLGGYPIVAVVITADLALAGQCRAGDRVRLLPVAAAAASREAASLALAIQASVAGRYPVVAG